MTDLRPRPPRLRLDPDSYRKLHTEVLERDGWRCQYCGTSDRLQVHHIRSQSQLGDDTDKNLITLCADCHSDIHRTCAVNDGSGTAYS
jgi:5-methylcytosine-specific restriction endonuclease McrA